MAIDINLNIYDASGSKHHGRINLYFGPRFGLIPHNEGEWISSIGMVVDGPWAYDPGNPRHDLNVAKDQLKSWIDDGYLSRHQGEQDSSIFLNDFPNNAVFNLWFVDWS